MLSCGSPVGVGGWQVASCRLQVAGCRLQVAGFRLQVATHHSLSTILFIHRRCLDFV